MGRSELVLQINLLYDCILFRSVVEVLDSPNVVKAEKLDSHTESMYTYMYRARMPKMLHCAHILIDAHRPRWLPLLRKEARCSQLRRKDRLIL